MGNRIKELREELHMTQIRLSTEIAVSQESISAYESGKNYPSVPSLLKLSQIFHASCDYILGTSDCRMPTSGADSQSQEDIKLEIMWKHLSPSEKNKLLAYADGLIDARNSDS